MKTQSFLYDVIFTIKLQAFAGQRSSVVNYFILFMPGSAKLNQDSGVQSLEPISKLSLALFVVMPAKAGIHKQLKYLDSGFRRHDKAVYDLAEKAF